MDRQFLTDLANAIDKAIDNFFDKEGIDRVYYEFKVYVNILNDNFDKINEVELINDEKEYHYCAFCRKPAYYYDSNLVDGYLCAECYNKLRKQEK